MFHISAFYFHQEMLFMLKIAICDDDEWIRRSLRAVIQKQTDVQADLYESGEELLAKETDYDILFLDICLKTQDDAHRLNGMETARELRTHSDALIIFITAAPDYVYEAYDVEAFHYLLKPIDEKKLEEVISRAAAKVEGKKNVPSLLIKTNGKFLRIPLEDIYYAENDGRKVALHTRKGEFSYYEKMEILEKKLAKGFFRCHRGYLVNLQEIAGYDRTSITLKCGDTVFLSKQKYGGFVAAYMDYLTK